MKPKLFLIFTFLFSFSFLQLSSQSRDEILAEAHLLYNFEKASWNGTDIFLGKFPEKRNDIGGYFAYSDNRNHNCIFFDKNTSPNVLAKITFDDTFDNNTAEIDTTKREFTKKEKNIFIIRKLALKEINQDTIFKTYKNTNLNVIPIITEKEKKVFVLTGPEISGVVIFGNDYLLRFNKQNKLIEKKSLHKNIIPIEYNEKTKEGVTMHSHLKSTGHSITSTDVCTLMLYGDYTNWTQHIVFSDKKVSLWSFENKHLIILTRKAWEKIYDTAKANKK